MPCLTYSLAALVYDSMYCMVQIGGIMGIFSALAAQEIATRIVAQLNYFLYSNSGFCIQTRGFPLED